MRYVPNAEQKVSEWSGGTTTEPAAGGDSAGTTGTTTGDTSGSTTGGDTGSGSTTQ